MADAEKVAQAIRQKPGIEYSALWLNQQGLERALRSPLHVDGVRISLIRPPRIPKRRITRRNHARPIRRRLRDLIAQ